MPCSMDDSFSPETAAPASSLHRLVITLWPEIAANVSGRTNSSAAFVITTWGSYPTSCSRRTSSTDLYAAIPPQTPTVTFVRSTLMASPMLYAVPHKTAANTADSRENGRLEKSFLTYIADCDI